MDRPRLPVLTVGVASCVLPWSCHPNRVKAKPPPAVGTAEP